MKSSARARGQDHFPHREALHQHAAEPHSAGKQAAELGFSSGLLGFSCLLLRVCHVVLAGQWPRGTVPTVLSAGDRLEPGGFDPLSHLVSGNMDQVCSSSLFLVPSLTFAPPWVKGRSLGQVGLFPPAPRLFSKATGTTGGERCCSEEHSPSQRGKRLHCPGTQPRKRLQSPLDTLACGSGTERATASLS